ncbi:MAG: 30S ribosomal protein S27ae [Candidatus Aenigmatarchaeota archaeon]
MVKNQEEKKEAKSEKEKKEKKSQKDKPKSKKKHAKVQIWKLYKIENGKVVRINENCPRCGAGTFLAKYKNRKYCGRCGWAQIIQETT